MKLSEDNTQLGSLALEIRLATDSTESAAMVHPLVSAMVGEMAAVPQLTELALTVDQIQAWFTLEGSAIVVRPDTEVVASWSAVAIPHFVQYVSSLRAGADDHARVPASVD